MRKSQILVLLFVLPIIALSCRSPQERSRGSIIGNGMIRFQNPIYKYSFAYDSRLTLIEQSQEFVAVEDRNLAEPKGLGLSKGIFEVLRVPTMKADELLLYAGAKFPEYAWIPIDGYGVPALSHQLSGGSTQEVVHLFYLDKNYVLQVHVTIGSSDQGAKLIREVMDSLVIDKESPIIHEMYFDPPTVRAGSTAKLKIRATDNFGNVYDRTSEQSPRFEHNKECRSLLNMDLRTKIVFPTCGTLRFLADDWYEIEIPTPPRLRQGFYILDSLTLGDEAGNVASISFPGFYCKSIAGFPCDGTMKPKSIRFAPLEIENDDSDVQAPILRNIRFEPATVVAGETSKLIFEASDDDPDFSAKAHVSLFTLLNSEVRPDSLSTGEGRYVIRPFTFDPPRHRDDGSWEMLVKSQAHVRPGSYDISFTIGDSAYNEASGHATLIVKNDAIVDVEIPRLLGIKASKNRYERGEIATILIKISDNLSSVEIGDWGGKPGCLSKMGFSFAVGPKAFRIISLCASELRHLKGDWYALDFKLGDNLPTGAYEIQSLALRDGVGNIGHFVLDANGNYFDEVRKLTTEGKRIKFQVVR